MKKTLSISIALSLMLVLGLVYSQSPGPGGRRGMGPGGMMDTAMHSQMAAYRMGHMMASSLVATSDGGVVLLVGNRLHKYDKNLALTKEAEVKIDTSALQQWRNMMGRGK